MCAVFAAWHKATAERLLRVALLFVCGYIAPQKTADDCPAAPDTLRPEAGRHLRKLL